MSAQRRKPTHPLNIWTQIRASFNLVLATLWHPLVGIWSILILGIVIGILGNVGFTLLTTGRINAGGIVLVFTWLLAHFVFSITLLILFLVFSVCSFFAHRRKQRFIQQTILDKQRTHDKSLVDLATGVIGLGEGIKDIATGVIQTLDELKTKPIHDPVLSLSKSSDSGVTSPATVWNLPYRRNPYFTGREHVLETLHNRIIAPNVTALVQPQAISGLGGIGKTQIAIEYAYRHGNDYQYVLWVNAASRDMLLADFVTLASLLDLPEKDEQKQDIILKAIKRWLENHEKWLLILDDVDDLALVYGFLPSRNTGYILMTMRTQVVGSIADMIPIEKMDMEEGIKLLLRRAKILAMDASLSQISRNEKVLAEGIVTTLDGLPLAVDQAGAYIEETRCSLSEYVDLYNEHQHRKILLQRRSFLPPGHPDSVATTWSLSFQRIEQANPAAADLLCLCAFLDPETIPEEIFTLGTPNLGPILRSIASDPIKLNEAIETLRRFSLIQRDPSIKLLNIHRLVQAVLLDRMDKTMQHRWAKRAVQAVNRTLPDADLTTLAKFRRYLSQALHCAILIDQYGFTFPAAVRLLDETAFYLCEYSSYEQAEVLYQRALTICEKVHGVEHPDTASRLNRLAMLFFQQGNYIHAEPLLLHALNICEKLLGSEHIDTAHNLSCLARLYIEQYKYPLAEPLLQRALMIYEKAFGTEDPTTAESLHHLAWVYEGQGNHKQAELLLQRSLTIHEKVLGMEHPNTANMLSSLGLFYLTQNKYALAEPLLKQALMIREKVLGPEHPNTANTLNNLAHVYVQRGKYDIAEELLLHALEVHEKTLGSEHLNTINILNSLANLYIEQNRYELAEPLLQRILAVRERVLGPEHLNTSTSLSNLAQLYIRRGKYDVAEPLLRRAVSIRENILGLENPNNVPFLGSYAGLLRKMQREKEAMIFEERVKAIQERTSF